MRRVSKKRSKRKQYGGEITNEDKIALANALQSVAFENGDGPMDQTKINDIIAHLETIPEYNSNTESNNIEQFIYQIDPDVPFKSMEAFDTWLSMDNGYNRDIERDTSVLEATSFDDKTKLNGGKKRKTRKHRKKKRRKGKTRRNI